MKMGKLSLVGHHFASLDVHASNQQANKCSRSRHIGGTARSLSGAAKDERLVCFQIYQSNFSRVRQPDSDEPDASNGRPSRFTKGRPDGKRLISDSSFPRVDHREEKKKASYRHILAVSA